MLSSYQISYHFFQRILSSRKQEIANIYSMISWVLAVEFECKSCYAEIMKPAQNFHIVIRPLSATMDRDFINYFLSCRFLVFQSVFIFFYLSKFSSHAIDIEIRILQVHNAWKTVSASSKSLHVFGKVHVLISIFCRIAQPWILSHAVPWICVFQQE